MRRHLVEAVAPLDALGALAGVGPPAAQGDKVVAPVNALGALAGVGPPAAQGDKAVPPHA